MPQQSWLLNRRTLLRGAGVALALPWLTWNRTYADIWPPSRWMWTARVGAALTARHVIWLAGLAVGSARARRIVL